LALSPAIAAVVGVVDAGGGRGLDDVGDRLIAGGADLRPEPIGAEAADRGDVRDRVRGQRDDGLIDEVVAVGQVDGLGPLGRRRDLVDVQVECLGAGL